MHHFVELAGKLFVDLRNHAVDDFLVRLLVGTGRCQQLRNEGLHALFRDLIALVVGLEFRLDHDLVEQGARGGVGRGGLSGAFGCLVWHGMVLLMSSGSTRSPYFFSSGAAPPPSSFRSFSLAAGSDTSDWIFFRNSGRLPRGPFSAVSASRSSNSLLSSGTWRATASGSMSFRVENLRLTGISDPSLPESLSATEYVALRFMPRMTSLKLSLSTLTGFRSSSVRSSGRPVKSPITRNFRGSSFSSFASPVAGLYTMLTRSLGATDPSFAMTFLLTGK